MPRMTLAARFVSKVRMTSIPVHPDMVIGGELVESSAGERYTVTNPANGSTVGTAPLASDDDAQRAIEAARAALASWRQTPVEARAAAIERGLDAVAAAQSRLAVLLTREHGKPLDESVAEIDAFLDRFRSYVRLARKTPDGAIPFLPSLRDTAFGAFNRPDTGVTVALIAWNYPIGLLAKKIAPPLLAGGAVVAKPAFSTPLATLDVVGLMSAALPPGVLNCVTGPGESVGQRLVTHPAVTRVHLTGSDATGQQVDAAAGHAERLLELAGSDAMIVCADADMDSAVRAAVIGRFRNAGQICTAVKRLYLAHEIYDDFARELTALVALRQPGDGLVPADHPYVRIGPLHTSENRDRLEVQLEDACQMGAEVLVGGSRPPAEDLAAGHFFEATVVARVSPQSKLVTEEVFGPVLPIFRTDGLDDAVEQANCSRWRLNASIWTSNRDAAERVGSRLQCRQVWINRLPFGIGTADARADFT
jgi:succinate-semialdehyde dehydrogenase/glutarate-semialdehyde dehydrogenase